MARTMPEHPVLEAGLVRLRPFRAANVDRLHEAMSDPVAMRFWDTAAHARRIESERVVKRSIPSTPEYWRVWAVADAADDSWLGLVNYHDGHVRNRRATIGYLLHPGWQGRGLATAAVGALMAHCFGALGLHRLQAEIHPDNVASRALAERLGFRCEGLMRGRLRVGEAWRDSLLYARLSGDGVVGAK
jgi:ribosomal-protein-alanine N-acetyltransferase